LIDNSQGHSAYLENALLISQMNVRPGRKQVRMQDGWFIQDGEKVIQPMTFPLNHNQYLNGAKGIKAILVEYGLY